jgi:hypothetical protein
MDLVCRPRHNIQQIASAYRVIVLKKGVQYGVRTKYGYNSLSSKGKLGYIWVQGWVVVLFCPICQYQAHSHYLTYSEVRYLIR